MILNTQYPLDYSINKIKLKYKDKSISTKVSLSKHRILIIDNDTACNSYQCLFLSKMGFTKFDIARSGVDAIDLAAKTNYSLILLEILLPDMNGLKVWKTIRKLKNHQSTKIIAVTNYIKDFIEDICKAYDISEVITKPITFDKYKDSILKIMFNNLNKG